MYSQAQDLINGNAIRLTLPLQEIIRQIVVGVMHQDDGRKSKFHAQFYNVVIPMLL